MRLTLESDQPILGEPEKLRGFFARRFDSFLLLHHHLGNNKLLYQYPRIQYKDIEGKKMVFGLSEGVEVLQSIYNQYDYVDLNGHKYPIYSKEIFIKEELFETIEKRDVCMKYKFLTPWFALNEENYAKYKDYTLQERTNQLNSILIQNILAIAKTFNYYVDKRILANVNLKETKINFKGKSIIGFLGTFQINFYLPEYIGLGKSVSRGFGTIKKEMVNHYAIGN